MWRIGRSGIYLPREVKDWMEYARWEVKKELPPGFSPWEEAAGLYVVYKENEVDVEVSFFEGRPSGRRDLDNVITTLCDTFEGVLFKNDRQIAVIHGVKLVHPWPQKRLRGAK